MELVPDFNDTKYQNLINILHSGTCIFFGAGISKLAGYKLWDELRYGMVDYFWINRKKLPVHKVTSFDFSVMQNLKSHDDIIEAFDYLYILDQNLFNTGIKEIFYEDEKKENPQIYSELNKFNNGKNFFITTNIDRGFERYLGIDPRSKSKDPSILNVYPDFNSAQTPPLLTYLHGRVEDSKNWVFTRHQYNEAYLNGAKPCACLLKDIFEKNSALFIGYGLMDFEIKQAISMTSKRKEHYWLEPTSRNTQDSLSIKATSFKENYNIELISYSIEGEGHNVAIAVIRNLFSAVENR